MLVVFCAYVIKDTGEPSGATPDAEDKRLYCRPATDVELCSVAAFSTSSLDLAHIRIPKEYRNAGALECKKLPSIEFGLLFKP